MSSADIPALLGGTPVRSAPEPVYNMIGDGEIAAATEVMKSGVLSGFIGRGGPNFLGGDRVKALEARLASFFGCSHAVSVNSATSALHAAVYAMLLEPGDEVIVSPYTMSATASSILFCGGVPVFADIEPDTFGLDPAAVEAAITPRTRGIMAVNIFGHPCRLEELRAIADRHGLFLAEDSAQAPGAMYKGRKAGTIGDAGVLSFNRHKTLQCGEGGALLTNRQDVAMRAALLRNHGEVCVDDLGITDIVNTAGLNFRMTEIEAAIADVQFSRIEELTEPRVKLARRLSVNLATIPGVTPPKVADDCTHAYYVYCPKVDEAVTGVSRDIFAKALTAEGFPTRAGYLRPIYLEPLYQRQICFGKSGFPFSANPRNALLDYRKGSCPVTERVQDHELLMLNCVYQPYSLEDMDKVAEAFRKIIAHADRLIALQAA